MYYLVYHFVMVIKWFIIEILLVYEDGDQSLDEILYIHRLLTLVL